MTSLFSIRLSTFSPSDIFSPQKSKPWPRPPSSPFSLKVWIKLLSHLHLIGTQYLLLCQSLLFHARFPCILILILSFITFTPLLSQTPTVSAQPLSFPSIALVIYLFIPPWLTRSLLTTGSHRSYLTLCTTSFYITAIYSYHPHRAYFQPPSLFHLIRSLFWKLLLS